jgi:hypothetical protein
MGGNRVVEGALSVRVAEHAGWSLGRDGPVRFAEKYYLLICCDKKNIVQ